MNKLKSYAQAFRAAHTWINVLREMNRQVYQLPVSQRGPGIEQIRKAEGMLGNVVLRIAGVYPIEDDFV